LGEAMATLMNDADRRRRMGETARRRADHFSVERMTDRTLDVYARVLGTAAANEASADSSRSSTRAP
jgi:glycosyltransferase involved in cell wall biosynthesis